MNKFTLSIIALAFTACSATTESPNPFDQEDNKSHKVQGPALDGKWQTACMADFGASKITTLQFSGQNLTRQTENFTDTACQNSKEKRSVPGTFRYMTKKANDVFTVEYRMQIAANVQQILEENIKLQNDVLWITNFISGDATPNIELKRVGPKPGPTPTPGDDQLTPIQSHSPQYGDSVYYEGTLDGLKITEEYVNQGTDDKTWTIFREIHWAGKIDMGYKYYTSLSSTAEYNTIMATCKNVEVIKVKAGVFKTCAVVEKEYKNWYGNIPIWGFVKSEKLDGSYKSELTKFYIGN